MLGALLPPLNFAAFVPTISYFLNTSETRNIPTVSERDYMCLKKEEVSNPWPCIFPIQRPLLN